MALDIGLGVIMGTLFQGTITTSISRKENASPQVKTAVAIGIVAKLVATLVTSYFEDENLVEGIQFGLIVGAMVGSSMLAGKKIRSILPVPFCFITPMVATLACTILTKDVGLLTVIATLSVLLQRHIIKMRLQKAHV